MEIKFIGTGSGKTSLKRFHSSLLISSYDFKLLVDAGDGISKAILNQDISFTAIDGILISHLHPDHFSGIGTLLVQMKLLGRKKRLDIFVHRDLVHAVKNFIFSSYLFEERMDFEINYSCFNNDEETAAGDEIKFTARQNTHLEPYLQYDKKNELGFSCSSFMFVLSGQNIFYTGDIGKPEDLSLFREQGTSILISESTHVSKENLLKAYEELRPGRIILTHIPDEDEQGLIDWKSSLSDEIRDNFIIAYDGMTIQI